MIQVFHGSKMVVREPLVGIGRGNLDFGQGFYISAQSSDMHFKAGISRQTSSFR